MKIVFTKKGNLRMRCCVPFCNNSSRNASKSQGISFHSFPAEPTLRAAWLRALSKKEGNISDRTCVCSQHFLYDDFYEAKGGARKVKVGAVPLVVQVCIICLDTDSKLYLISKYKLEEAYENLTGLSLCDVDSMPQTLCIQCSQRLMNCSRFRQKSLRAHTLMLELVKKHEFLTLQNIKTINREDNQLTSNIIQRIFQPDHSDLYLVDDESDKLKELDKNNTEVNDVEVKDEKTDDFMYIDDDYVPAKEESNENNDVDCTENDEDFVVTKDYSTDDSLPLEIKRRKIKKVKTRKVKKVTKKEEPKVDRRRKPFLNDDLNETLFTITDLSFDEQVAEIEKRQETSNYKNSTFKCTVCFKGFLDEDAYNGHMTRHTTQCGDYECDICKTHFKHQHALRKHITAHHTQRFSCNSCPYVTTHRQTARLHERWHKGTKYQCPHCLDEFVTSHHMHPKARFTSNNAHKSSTHTHHHNLDDRFAPKPKHHQEDRLHDKNRNAVEPILLMMLRFRGETIVEIVVVGVCAAFVCVVAGESRLGVHVVACPACISKFTTYMGHIRIKHPSDFVCVLCGYSFVSEKGIDLHKKLKHRLDTGEIPADGPLCELCNIRFLSEAAYRRHLQVSAKHNEDSDAKDCSKSKGRRSRREEKKRDRSVDNNERKSYPSQIRKAEGPIPCEQCGMQLEDSRAYHGHFRRHHPDKNRTNYPSMKSPFMCETCGRMFQSYALLKDHSWVHTGERPFACESCGKSFRMKQRLVAHRRVHNQIRSMYVCNLCGKSFSTHSNRQRHMVIHTGLKPFKCEMCGKCFKHSSEKRAHITYVHLKKPWPKRARSKRRSDRTQCGDYECDICKTHFKHQHALRKHITAHHTQRFSCNSCPYVTTHRQTARLHERWHKGTKYQCPHCLDEFVKFTTYMGHIRIKHPSDFVCVLCGYSFVSEKGIDLHKKLKHRLDTGEIPEDGPLCELCNIRFLSEAAYRRHLQVSAKHNGDSDAKDCSKSKGRRSRREEKKRDRSVDNNERKSYPSQIRKAEGPIPCEQCGMQLEDSRAYHGHFRRHHPDKNRTNYPSMKSPFMCETCGRMFQSYALLKDHSWVHTGERPFACESCGKSFRMKQRLVAHRRVHNQIRSMYVCNLCGKSFSTHSNRQRHMVIHTGLKPFKCEMCGKCFKHSSEKRAHITYVHLKKPWPKRARSKRRSDRPGQMQTQGSVSAGASEMDIGPSVWSNCDPKMATMNMMDDKPMYYNLKI